MSNILKFDRSLYGIILSDIDFWKDVHFVGDVGFVDRIVSLLRMTPRQYIKHAQPNEKPLEWIKEEMTWPDIFFSNVKILPNITQCSRDKRCIALCGSPEVRLYVIHEILLSMKANVENRASYLPTWKSTRLVAIENIWNSFSWNEWIELGSARDVEIVLFITDAEHVYQQNKLT